MNTLLPYELPKLYVGCGLTFAPEDFRNEVEELKANIANDGWQVMKFLGLTAGSARDVYVQDIERNVRQCDAFLGIADYPATGLGAEFGVADERETPTLIVAKIGCKVTRLLEGAADARGHVKFKRYETMSEIPALVQAHLLPMVK